MSKVPSKIQNSYQIMKVSEFNWMKKMREAHMTSFGLFEITNFIYFNYFNII